ncbi:hypothetical protein QP568_07765 [Propionimicrobium lymphophilum]|uniref:hypothetical protein n=1 Tax=Propionimicrobium lymphophilum TaxID=33012 RepID=UPI00254E0A7B|nr:hypothetical protein [Propionimicrobium lymphophilum]MDK7710166.1 hypothetical protein [Propionimicrobium lymphophilum]MDK7734181.1 hypothetical protein [Propionimicrobium lymphophilum]
MEAVKNAGGKTICRVDLERRQIEIVHKGFLSRLWFDDYGGFHQRHERRRPPLESNYR